MTGQPEALLFLSHQTRFSLKKKGNRGKKGAATECQNGEGRGPRPPEKVSWGWTPCKLWLFPLLYGRSESLPTFLSQPDFCCPGALHTHSCGGLFRSLSPGPLVQGPLANGRLSQDHDLLRKVVPSASGLYCLLDSPWHLMPQQFSTS